MSVGSFCEEGSWVVAPRVFEFIVGLELRRAVRSQAFLTFVMFDTARERDGTESAPDEASLREIAHVIGGIVRDTDLVGHCDERTLALVLLHSDFEHSVRVIDRLVGRLEHYQFLSAIRIAIGAAAYPRHAVDVESLKHEATMRLIVTLHGGAGRPAGLDDLSAGQN